MAILNTTSTVGGINIYDALQGGGGEVVQILLEYLQ